MRRGRPAVGEGRTQGHCFPLREDGFQEGPPALICAHLSLCSLSPQSADNTLGDRDGSENRPREGELRYLSKQCHDANCLCLCGYFSGQTSKNDSFEI